MKANFKTDEHTDVQAKELSFQNDPSDRYWKFEANNLNTLWKLYDSSNVHHVSTQAGVDVSKHHTECF